MLNKNNDFLLQELHHKKLLRYFKNVIEISEKGPVLPMKRNTY